MRRVFVTTIVAMASMLFTAMERGNCILFAFALIFLFLDHSECFQWTRNQESSRAINTHLGSDVSLPCDFLLTSDEESAMKQFNLIYWTRETPAGSQNWQGLAAKTNLFGNSKPTIIHRRKNHYAMVNNSLVILSVELEDDGVYQCEVKSSFSTLPTAIKVKTSTKQKSPDKQTSPLSNKASAGIGVGVTLLLVAFIAGVAILCLVKKNREQVAAREPANVGNVTRDDAAEAYIGPGFPGIDIRNGAVENQSYSTSKTVCTTTC